MIDFANKFLSSEVIKVEEIRFLVTAPCKAWKMLQIDIYRFATFAFVIASNR